MIDDKLTNNDKYIFMDHNKHFIRKINEIPKREVGIAMMMMMMMMAMMRYDDQQRLLEDETLFFLSHFRTFSYQGPVLRMEMFPGID